MKLMYTVITHALKQFSNYCVATWQVLTSKWCSEEGLEDATNLLLQLSKAHTELQELVLKLLLVGARELGMTVCEHIR